MGTFTTAALVLGSSVATTPVASAAPSSCAILTADWWISDAPVGTSLYHFVVADKPINGGGAAEVCVWLVADRTIPGGHTSKLDISKPGKDIHIKSTQKWTLMTPTAFRVDSGKKFKAIANVTVKNPAYKSGKHTVHRELTVNIGSNGVLI